MPRTAIYRKIAQKLVQEIENGVYAVNNKMPTEQDLSAKFDCSRQTIRMAFNELEKQGLIKRVQGSGTFINKNKPINKANNNIAVITTYITDYIFPNILRGIEYVLTKNSYSMELSSTYNRISNERAILKNYISNPPAGLIVEGTKTALPNPNIDLYLKLQQMDVPMVFINGYYKELENTIAITVADSKGSAMLLDYLYNKGHKNIAGIFKSDDMQGVQRYSGFIQGLLSKNIAIVEDNIAWYTTESIKTFLNFEIEKFIKSIKDCTAVICYNDKIALPIISMLAKLGIEKEVVSFDNSEYAKLSHFGFISLNHPKNKLGEKAAIKVISLIDGEDESSEVFEWGELIDS